MVKRPFIWILCLFMIGIVCNKYICSIFGFIPIFFGTCFLCFQFFFILKRKYSISSDVFLFILPFILCLGYFLPTYYNSNNQLNNKFLNCSVHYQGRIVNVIQKSSFKEIYLADIMVSKERKKMYISQLLLQDTSEGQYIIGDWVAGQGDITEFEAASNPGQFDTKAFYEAKGIRYRVWKGKIIRKVSGENQMYRWLTWFKESVGHVYDLILPKEDSQILQAMVLGEKGELDSEIKNLYQKAGISHILAISGLHVSMIGLFLFRLLKKVGLHHNIASLGCMILIYLYGLMTGFSVSTSRAVIMMCLALSACLFSRSYDSKSAVAASGLFILFQEPYQLFQCGFQLSFAAVAGALWFYPFCLDYLSVLFPDFQNRISILEKSEYYNIKVLVWKLTKGFRNSLLVSCSIQMITLPVLAWHYFEFASLAPVLNLFILPLSSLLILLAILAGGAGIFFLPIARFLGGSIHGILSFYHFLCELFQKVPFQNIITGRPKGVQVLVYVALLIAFGILGKKKNGKRAGLLLPFALLILFLRIPVSELKVTMLDVGQGDGIFMKNEKGITFLVDGGSTSVKQVGNYRIVPFLKFSGIRKINYCMLTHLDEDHINGVQEMIRESKESGSIQIANLVLPHLKEADEAYDNMVHEAKMAGIRVRYMEPGQQIVSGRLKLTCLHPSYSFTADDRNSLSLVLELSYDAFRMLLTGDVDETGEKKILADGRLKGTYSVLKIAHHGSRYSSCEEWLDKVNPRIAFISCGCGNRYGHPHKELLERLKERNIKVYRTDLQGTVTFVIKGKKGSIFNYRKVS